jgi:hypothetical protein
LIKKRTEGVYDKVCVLLSIGSGNYEVMISIYAKRNDEKIEIRIDFFMKENEKVKLGQDNWCYPQRWRTSM